MIRVSWLSHTSINTTFLSKATDYFFFTCFCRGERRKYAGKKSCLNRGSNSQPPGHDSDTLTTEPSGRGHKILDRSKLKQSADDNFKFDENSRKISKRVENSVGKGEIARSVQFLLFPQCLQNACFPGASTGVIVWERVNSLPHNPDF